MKNALIVVIVLAVILVGWKLLSNRMAPGSTNGVSEGPVRPVPLEEQEKKMDESGFQQPTPMLRPGAPTQN